MKNIILDTKEHFNNNIIFEAITLKNQSLMIKNDKKNNFCLKFIENKALKKFLNFFIA